MGKASRRKQEHRSAVFSDRPRWAGANGFEYAWTLTEMYLAAGEYLLAATDRGSRAAAAITALELKMDLVSRRIATLEAALNASGGQPRSEKDQREPWLPGVSQEATERWIDEGLERHRPYALALRNLAVGHKEALLRATPILFDPLAVPEPDDGAADGLRLPFPYVTCDYLTTTGMSMPVQVLGDDLADDWVGLIAATFRQAAEGTLDVWPVVTTLHAREVDENQKQRSLLFGCVRFGGPLPDPPSGLTACEFEHGSVWAVVDEASGGEMPWAEVWVLRPALAAASSLRLLEAVNVSLETATLPRPERRRAMRSGAQPALEVVIRRSHMGPPPITHGSVDWQHRWTVRGHWKHFKRGAIFEANPRKRVVQPDGSECVRVWCPPFVKGPDDKPLVLKARRADHDLEVAR